MKSYIGLLRHHALEILVATALFLVPAGIVLISTDAQNFQLERAPRDDSFFTVFAHIVTTNVSSALFLFTGVITHGITTLIECVVLGILLGISIQVAIGTLGVMNVIAQTWLYTPFEIYGFVLAGASGLVVVRHILTLGERPLHAFRNAHKQSLALLIHSVAILSISAVLETIVIV